MYIWNKCCLGCIVEWQNHLKCKEITMQNNQDSGCFWRERVVVGMRHLETPLGCLAKFHFLTCMASTRVFVHLIKLLSYIFVGCYFLHLCFILQWPRLKENNPSKTVQILLLCKEYESLNHIGLHLGCDLLQNKQTNCCGIDLTEPQFLLWEMIIRV